MLDAYRELWERLERAAGRRRRPAASRRCRSARCSRGDRSPSRAARRAGRSVHQRRSADRRRRLLPRDGDSAASRAACSTSSDTRTSRAWRSSTSAWRSSSGRAGPARQAHPHRRHRRDATAPWLTVVGVVGRVKQYTLDGDSRIAMYLPHAAVTGASDERRRADRRRSGGADAAARQAIRALDPDLPIYNVRTMERARRRIAGAAAFLDAAADAVRRARARALPRRRHLRRHRLSGLHRARAISASAWRSARRRRRSCGSLFGHGMTVAAAGVAAGLAGALLAARLLDAVLFEVRATDPLTFVGVALSLASSRCSCSIPLARRAARIDPARTLSESDPSAPRTRSQRPEGGDCLCGGLPQPVRFVIGSVTARTRWETRRGRDHVVPRGSPPVGPRLAFLQTRRDAGGGITGARVQGRASMSPALTSSIQPSTLYAYSTTVGRDCSTRSPASRTGSRP